MLSLLVVASCVPGDEHVIDIHSALTDCDDIVCGNTPKLGGQPFWELDQSKKDYSPVGRFRIKSFRLPNNTPLTLRVQGFQLLGVTDKPATYAGKGLEGSKLVIESEGGGEFELTIDAASTIPFVEDGDDGTKIPTFRLRYLEVVNAVTTIRFMCPSDNIHAGGKYAIAFAGDRYDQVSGKVSATGAAAKPWFNLACEDDALWKLAVFRHVQAAQDLPEYETNVDDRNAALKAIRADYCGNNHPWTELGKKVDWANWRGWLSIDTYSKVEAIWDADKAYCLSNPRDAEFSDITCWPDYTKHYCSTDDIDNWVANGHRMITYVP